MNKRGFTVMELLSVIVILGIILMIAIPAYMGSVNDARAAAFEAGESAMESSANNLIIDCQEGFGRDNNCTTYALPKVGESIKIPLYVLVEGNCMDEIQDPMHQGKPCDTQKSYVIVKNEVPPAGSSALNLIYQPCLYCGEYRTNGCTF